MRPGIFVRRFPVFIQGEISRVCVPGGTVNQGRAVKNETSGQVKMT